MTTTEPKVALNGKYNQTQTAVLLEVDRKTIYRYIKGGLLKAHQGRTGRLFVTGRDIIRLWNII